MLEKLRSPERLRKRGKQALGVIAAGLLLSTCISSSVQPQPSAPPAKEAPAPAAHNICKPLDPQTVKIRSDFIIHSLTSRLMSGGTFEHNHDPAYWARMTRLHVVDTQPYKNKINKTANTIDKVRIAGQLTHDKFGFDIKVVDYSDPKTVASDLTQITDQLNDMPVELVKAVNLDTVYLESPEPAKKNPPAGAFVTLGKNLPNDITIAPGRGDAFKHEFGHHIQGAYQEKQCSALVNYEDTEYASANPPEFSYTGIKSDPTGWDNITVEKHGARSVREDEATMADTLMTRDYNRGDKIDNSEVLARKLGIVTLHMDTIAPRTGAYYQQQFLELSPALTETPGS